MRNGAYTIYQGYDLIINTIRDNDDKVILTYKGEVCPFDNFRKDIDEDNAHYLIINIMDLTNAFFVKTFGIYKGYKFQVFDLKGGCEGSVRIGTSDRDAFNSATGLGDDSRHWYIQDIKKSELERIWEERTQVLDLPMPKGLELNKEISI